jgi:hypothetical protein
VQLAEIVLVAEEAGFPVVAALHDVQGHAMEVDAGVAGHGPMLGEIEPENHLAGLPPPGSGGVKVGLPTLFNPKEAEMRYCGIDLHSNN